MQFKAFRPLLVTSLLSLFSLNGLCENHILVLSGGVHPEKNNLSQYLQTRLLAETLMDQFGDNRVDVLFAAGQSHEKQGPLADVYVEREFNGVNVPFMQAGFIKRNAPATEENVRMYFSSSPGLGGQSKESNDTFFLLVSDHGSPGVKAKDFENNCINLWAYKEGELPDPSQACLSRKELQNYLGSYVKASRTVYAMTQCYSGGFHKMAVDNKNGYPSVRPGVCGFTATTEDSIASGCVSNVDGDNYKGYERYLTEQITGKDIVTSQPISGGPKKNLKEAHKAAALQDFTLDIPLSSSDYYLNQWAQLLEGEEFKSRTSASARRLKELYYQAASQGVLLKADLLSKDAELVALLKDRIEFLSQMETAVMGADSQLRGLLRSQMHVKSLEKALLRIGKNLEYLEGELALTNQVYDKAMSAAIAPAWAMGVEGDQVVINDMVLDKLERAYYIPLEREFAQTPDIVAGMLKSITINLMAEGTLTNPEVTNSMGEYFATRDQRRLKWVKSLENEKLTRIVEIAENSKAKIKLLELEIVKVQTLQGLLRRIVLMRKQLGALAVLTAAQDAQALQDYKSLQDCEGAAY